MPCDTSQMIPPMEDTERHSCGNCVFSNPPDEDGLVECRYFPPELLSVGGKVVQMRPRLHPSTPYCGMYIER